MANQYGYTGLTPQLHLRREAYRKGLRSGRGSKAYTKQDMMAGLRRFTNRYGAAGDALMKDWLEGWHDAAIYRDLQVIGCEVDRRKHY